MFPDSDFAVPVSSFQRPVPLVFVDPDKDASVTVCFNAAWQPYIIGALQQLVLQTTWDTEPGAALDLVQQRAMALIGLFGVNGGNCASQTPESDYEMAICEQLRFEDGKLQGLCCGEWVDIPGLQGAITGGVTQPEPGGTVALGDCVEYDVVLDGTGLWKLPVPAYGGDTIEVTVARGGWYDGSFTSWRCPDGQDYAFGLCAGSEFTDGADPAPSIYHMRLIADVGGSFVDAFNTTINVVGGTSPQDVVFQANDSILTDNAGSITFHVKYCRASVVNWCARYDAAHGWTGWSGVTVYGCAPTLSSGIWNSCHNSFPYENNVIAASLVAPAGVTITRVRLIGNATDTNPASNQILVQDGAGNNYSLNVAGPGTPLTMDKTGMAAIGLINFTMTMNGQSGNPTNIQAVEIYGTGTPPAWAAAQAC